MIQQKKPKAVIYIRVSTVDQAVEGYSLAAQQTALKKLCDSRSFVICSVYADEGISAKDISHRPAMCEMLEQIKQGDVDFVVVWALSRLTRSVRDLYTTLELFSRYGCELVSYTESFDTGTYFGRAMVGILAVFAQMEREQTAERVKAAMAERASQGKRTANEVLGYDLDGTDRLRINVAEAELIRYIYSQYLEYRNLSAVAKLCKVRGYKGKRGGTLKAQHIKIILTRAIYVGYNVYLGRLYKGTHPAIIEIDKWDEVQQLIGRPSISEQLENQNNMAKQTSIYVECRKGRLNNGRKTESRDCGTQPDG